MRYHLETYRALEESLYREHVELFQRDPKSNSECFELIFAFEGFMFQMKSALDMMVKILKIVQLKNQVQTSTYRNEGEDAIKGLAANKTALEKLIAEGKQVHGRLPGLFQELITHIQSAQDTWLRDAVELRDIFSHYEAAKEFAFLPKEVAPGKFDAVRPVFNRNGQSLAPILYMESLFHSCAEFCQDFLCRAMNLNAPYYELRTIEPQQVASYAGTTPAGPFLKWSWWGPA
jgi:hypothetical protein